MRRGVKRQIASEGRIEFQLQGASIPDIFDLSPSRPPNQVFAL